VEDKEKIEAATKNVREKYAELKKAVDNYHDFLDKTEMCE